MPTSPNSISTFKAAFNGGTRVNRFEIDFTNAFPIGINVFKPNLNEKLKIYSASLPAASLGTITVPYRGRMLNIAGDREYKTWDMGIYDDNNSDNLWRSFQHWKEKMDGHVSHQVGGGTPVNNFSYKQLQTTWVVKQLDLNGTVIRRINLYNCWPVEVGAITLQMDSDQFTKFGVKMTFDYFQIQTGL